MGDDKLREGDPICGKAVSNTRDSFFIPANGIESARIKRFFDLNPNMHTNCDWGCVKSKASHVDRKINGFVQNLGGGEAIANNVFKSVDKINSASQKTQSITDSVKKRV